MQKAGGISAGSVLLVILVVVYALGGFDEFLASNGLNVTAHDCYHTIGGVKCCGPLGSANDALCSGAGAALDQTSSALPTADIAPPQNVGNGDEIKQTAQEYWSAFFGLDDSGISSLVSHTCSAEARAAFAQALTQQLMLSGIGFAFIGGSVNVPKVSYDQADVGAGRVTGIHMPDGVLVDGSKSAIAGTDFPWDLVSEEGTWRIALCRAPE